MRTVLIIGVTLAATGVAHADRPTKATAKETAQSWVKAIDAGGAIDPLTAPTFAVHDTGCDSSNGESSKVAGHALCFAREQLAWAPTLSAVSASGVPRTLRKFKRALRTAAKDHVLIAGKVRADMEHIDYVVTVAIEDDVARVDALYYAFTPVTEND